ncbi:hypothetical protein [Erwinia papayae]|uniref:hypothetical protein n=1 Tax=Erwinia papayae TaxID=206499 RepID=UPI00345B7A25
MKKMTRNAFFLLLKALCAGAESWTILSYINRTVSISFADLRGCMLAAGKSSEAFLLIQGRAWPIRLVYQPF